MYYYFLKEDFEALNLEIQKAADKIKEAGQEMGKSCGEGAETYHDNFAYEEGYRQQQMWSGKIRELINVRNQAHVVDPQVIDSVSLGCTVTISDEDTGEEKTFKIGSYMVLAKVEKETVSYNAPLARALIGKKVDDTAEITINKKKRVFTITDIS